MPRKIKRKERDTMASQQDSQKKRNNASEKKRSEELQAGEQGNGRIITAVDINAVLQQASWETAMNQIGPHYTKVMKPEKIRDRAQLEENIHHIIEQKKGLILSGPVGVGKTTDLVYIMNRIITETMQDYARWLLSITRDDTEVAIGMMVDRIKHIISYHFAPELFNQLHEAKEIEITPFFIIDDLGRQYNEPFAVSRFEAIIEEMYRTEKTLIITTNLTRDDFLSITGWGRITDRLREMCNFMRIPGNSMRHK
jgi:DNA replication protein DnaC